ncbi:MAG: TolC family protein [Beijerinckiaceae bacterium]|nr:TolC family protein [Beijerinckiaceae bacterium]
MRLSADIPPRRTRRHALSVPAILSASLLAGCASFTPDGGISVAQNVVRTELGQDVVKINTDADAASVDVRVKTLLKKPLSADRAVQIALLNNRGLQAAYNQLGISEAAYVAATLPPSPTISFSSISGDRALELERRLVGDILALATLPARSEIAAGRFRQAQLKAAYETLSLAVQTRRAYYDLVASNQLVGYLVQAQAAAGTTSELFKKLGETGAVNKIEQGREHAFTAEVLGQLAKARLRQAQERERLTRLMGLWGESIAFTVPSALPSLPRRPLASASIEMEAVKRRVDLQMARVELETTGKALGAASTTQFVNLFSLTGYNRLERTTKINNGVAERERLNRFGIEAELQIPIYDFGETKIREARESYLQSVNLLADKAVTVRSEAREAYQKYRGTYDIARHYQGEILPLWQGIYNESQLQFNGMLFDVTKLLADARLRIQANAGAIDARRDFWLADADLKAAIIGGGTSTNKPEAVANTASSAGSD